MVTILELTDEHRVIGRLIAAPPDELWDDGRHNLAEVPGGAVWWVAVDEHDAVLALGVIWQEPDGAWRSGCNAELGWRGRDERYWPDLHQARQRWLAEQHDQLGIKHITTWLHDEQGAAPGTAAVVRTHLDTGWTLTGANGTLDGGRYARQLAWRPAIPG